MLFIYETNEESLLRGATGQASLVTVASIGAVRLTPEWLLRPVNTLK